MNNAVYLLRYGHVHTVPLGQAPDFHGCLDAFHDLPDFRHRLVNGFSRAQRQPQPAIA